MKNLPEVVLRLLGIIYFNENRLEADLELVGDGSRIDSQVQAQNFELFVS